MSDEKYIDKVMKLLAKAEKTTPEEAEALVAKATELMVRHEIDEAMLATAQGLRVQDTIVEKRILFRGTYSIGQRDLMFAVGRAQGFRLIQGGSGALIWGTWIGFKRDIAAAEMLLTSLLIQQAREANRFMKDNPPPDHATAFEKFALKRSHTLGFAEGVGSIIRQARRAATEEAQAAHAAASPDSDTSVALVLKSKDEQVKDWYDTRYGKLRAGRARRLSTSYSARDAGVSAGRSANLGGTAVGSQKAIGR